MQQEQQGPNERCEIACTYLIRGEDIKLTGRKCVYLNMKVGIEITNERRSAGQSGLPGALDRLLHNVKKGREGYSNEGQRIKTTHGV